VQVILDAVDANTANIAQGYLQQGMLLALSQYNSWNGLDPTTPTSVVQVRSTNLQRLANLLASRFLMK
jgi:hypothetical protein